MGVAAAGERRYPVDQEDSRYGSEAFGQLERHLEVSPYLADKKKQAEELRLEILALSHRCREERAMWSRSGVHQIHWSSMGSATYDTGFAEDLEVLEVIKHEKMVSSTSLACGLEETSPGPRAREDGSFGPFRPRLPAEEPWNVAADEYPSVQEDQRPILTSAVEQRGLEVPQHQMASRMAGSHVHHKPQVHQVHDVLQGQPGPGAWIGPQVEVPPSDCMSLGAASAFPPKSLRHSIAYSNWNGQEQIQETRVTCAGDECETMSNNVMPQIIRVRPLGHKAAKQRMCSGSPSLVWDNMDQMMHRMTNSARWLLGYAPTETVAPQEAVEVPQSEGVMKVYSYFNSNGHEELKEVESHCKDGACVQRSRTLTPTMAETAKELPEVRPVRDPDPMPRVPAYEA